MTLEYKKTFTVIGLSLLITFILINILQIISKILCGIFSEGIIYKIIDSSGVTIGMFLFVIPIISFILRKLPTEAKEKKTASFHYVFILIIISLGIICLVNFLRIAFFGFRQNVIVQPQNFSIYILLSCIGAAISEEIIFRKIIFERIRPYGDKEAIVVSALAFGLCHMNLWSFLFAFLLGLIWGNITVKTNSIKYSCIIHIANNIIMVNILPYVGIFIKKPEIIINAICVFLILLGTLLLLIERKSIIFIDKTVNGIGIKQIFKNIGMASFLIISIIVIVFIFIMQL